MVPSGVERRSGSWKAGLKPIMCSFHLTMPRQYSFHHSVQLYTILMGMRVFMRVLISRFKVDSQPSSVTEVEVNGPSRLLDADGNAQPLHH